MKLFSVLLIFVLFLQFHSINAQNKIITGKVTSSETSAAIPGVSVVLKGTALGTITNSEGTYNLEVPQNAQTLIFSFVGMQTLEMPVSSNNINVSLKTDYIGIEEVFALGYTEKGKNEITGSSFQVKGSTVTNVPVTSFDQALQGKIPGLVVSAPSGTPGTMQDLRIRGVGSITASNNPLFVIDGVPVINPDFTGEIQRSTFSALSSLKSSDIESITVLKDASATSAYGARGSNGVIVITTKKGKIGKTRFSLNTSVGFQNNATDGLIMLNGVQREELMLEAVHNTFNVPVDQAYNFLIDNKITYSLKTWVETYNRKEGDWDELLKNKNALVQNYNISAEGGDEVSNFYASLGYNNTEATAFGGEFSRISGKFNYQRHFTEKVKFAVNTMVSDTKQDAFLEQSAYYGNPHATRYMMSPWEQPYLADGVNLNTATTSSYFNTLYTLENDIFQNDLTRGMINSFLEWEIIDNLIFKTVYAGDYNVAAFHGYQNRVHGDGKVKGGTALQSVTRNYNWVSQNSFDYNFALNEHNIGIKALMEYQENNNNFLSGTGEKFPADGLYYLSAASSNLDANGGFTDWKNLSYLGMANYNFKNKYIADLTYRYEGSSLFAPDSRFGNFWSAGAAWNISEEGFLSEIKNIDYLRLRASYGLSGSSAIGINQYQALLAYDKSYANEGAVYPKQIGNPDLTWEKNKNFDVGIDYAFFNGRLKGSAAYYHKYTYDLLQNVPVSRTMGHEAMMMNVGSMINKGFEIIVQGDIFRDSEFNLNVGLNLASVNNEVTELASDASGNEINIENLLRKVAVGHPVYGWYMRKWAGVNSENGNAQWYKNGVDGEVTESYYAAKKEWQGESAIPKLTGGILTHADYKGFYLDLNLYYAGGHKVYEDLSFLTHYTGFYSFSLYNGVVELMDRWQKPGDITEVPKVWYSTRDDSRESTRFLFEGDYLRVKDLVFGYRIPAKYTGKIGFENVDIYARGTNLFTFVKDDGLKYDPEVGADGLTRFTTPPVKSVVFGINLNF
ncbi:MAG TPA: SusC/RagA family TonB-linked outer membrane protein [Draconibacterium sp.]|nr:SusC/RagA family TonB-linked outer membrane protein [Draconibacterium sp.]